MRTIKFRGKRKLNGEWVYGSLISIGDDWCQIVPEGTDYDTLKEDLPIIRVITDTIGQFTGLLDKNGVEIYEGDVLKSEMYGSGVVRWDDDKTEFAVMDGHDRYFVLSFGEITGNIHDK